MSLNFKVALKANSHLSKKNVLFASRNTLQFDEKCFLFHLKIAFVLKMFKFLS